LARGKTIPTIQVFFALRPLKKEIPPQLVEGARVRIIRVRFGESSSHQQFVGKTGIVQKREIGIGAVVVLLNDGSTRVCFPENLEVIDFQG
jgi:hypothetical protein